MRATRKSVLSKIVGRRAPEVAPAVTVSHAQVQDTDQYAIMVAMIDKGNGPYAGLKASVRLDMINALGRLVRVSPVTAEMVVTMGNLGQESMREAMDTLSTYAKTNVIMAPVAL